MILSCRRVSLALLALAMLGVTGCDQMAALSKKLRGGKDPSPGGPGATVVTEASSGLPGGVVHIIGEGNYDAVTADPKRLVIVDFYADWCGPCRKLVPILQTLATEFPDNVLFLKVNVDQSPKLASKAGVSGIPDVRFLIHGQEMDRMIGLGPIGEIRSKIQKHAPPVASEPAAQPADGKSGGPLGLVDKLREAMPATAPDIKEVTAKVKEKLGGEPAPPPVPATPPIVPIKRDEEWLPPGVSKSKPSEPTPAARP